MLVAILSGIGLALSMAFSVLMTLGVTLAIWILLATVTHVVQRLRHGGANILKLPRSFWGMVAAHIGVGVFVIGVTLVKGHEVVQDKNMQLGDKASISGLDFRFIEMKKVQGPNYTAAQGTFVVTRHGVEVAVMKPEKRLFTVQQMPMTEAAINRGLTRDLYVSLGDQTNEHSWVVRIQHKPFVGWIWAGCLLIAFGGLLAASDRRYRLKNA